MRQQTVELDFLNGFERLDPLIGRRSVGNFFARLHKSKRVPIAAGRQSGRQCFFAYGFEQARYLTGDVGETGMLADAMEPVPGVAVVRLAPMHDAVQETAAGVAEVLRNGVGLVEIIMPQ